MVYLTAKRIFDFMLALAGLLVFSPLILVFSLVVLVVDGPPIFYIKKSLGKNGKVINIVKFRSMKGGSEEITKSGKFLRATAMDELPQLWNILKGDMSFVGPRPYRVDKFSESDIDRNIFTKRLEVTPGLTGLAQIYAPKYASDDEVLRWDLEYIKRRCFWLDIKTIMLSVYISCKRNWENKFSRL